MLFKIKLCLFNFEVGNFIATINIFINTSSYCNKRRLWSKKKLHKLKDDPRHFFPVLLHPQLNMILNDSLSCNSNQQVYYTLNKQAMVFNYVQYLQSKQFRSNSFPSSNKE